MSLRLATMATLGVIFEQAGAPVAYLSEEFLRETSTQSTILVAEVDAQIEGYLQYQVLPPDLHLNASAFRPDFQSQGLGGRLFTQAVLAVHKAGYTRIMNAVQMSNPEIHRLYLRLGFLEEAGDDDWKGTLSMSMDHALSLIEKRKGAARRNFLASAVTAPLPAESPFIL